MGIHIEKDWCLRYLAPNGVTVCHELRAVLCVKGPWSQVSEDASHISSLVGIWHVAMDELKAEEHMTRCCEASNKAEGYFLRKWTWGR